MNSKNINTALKKFEEENAKDLAKIEFDNFLVWPMIKLQMQFYFFNQGRPTANNVKPISFFNKINIIVQSCFELIKLYVSFKKIRAQKITLINTNGAVRWLKNKEGKMMNMWLDGFVLENIIENPFLLETRNNPIQNSAVNLNFNEKYLILASKISSLYIKLFQKKTIFSKAIEIQEILTKNNIDFPLSNIINSINSFQSEKYTYNWLLKKMKPTLVLCYDKPTTGFIAATNVNKIPSIDVQHGLIGQYYGSYNFNKYFKNFKSKIALPSKIALFGNLERDELLLDEFWDNDELYIGGSYRMYLNKKNISFKNEDYVLVCTENINPSIILGIIEFLAANQIKLKIRFHPAETQKAKEQFINLEQKYKNTVEIIPNEIDLYEAINKSSAVIGHYSTVLLESLEFKKKVFSIEIEENDNGICKFYRIEKLYNNVNIVKIKNIFSILELLKIETNLEIEKDFLFAEDYINNNVMAIKTLLN